MQSRLIDVNTAFIIYRREALNSLKSSRYDSCFGSLYTLNGMLPEKYRVIISTKQYNEITNQDIIAYCKNCNEQVKYSNLKVFKLFNNTLDAFVTEKEFEKVWSCPKCHQCNILEQTRMTQKTLEEPYFIKTVPRPPERKDGIMDRKHYHKKVGHWVWVFLQELESQMAKFRDDYSEKGEGGETEYKVDIEKLVEEA